MQAAERKERRETKHSKRMGEDGIADDDLQVVSGEREMENLDPKERAKVEKKRGLIRAGMGNVTDDVDEDTGFEVAKANNAAMAMLGGGRRPSYAVEGLEVADDRDYGSDEVGKMAFMCMGMVDEGYHWGGHYAKLMWVSMGFRILWLMRDWCGNRVA